MMSREQVNATEQNRLEQFFAVPFFDLPALPDWVTNEHIQFWHDRMFHLHYIPDFVLDEQMNLPAWQDKPDPFFYKQIREGALEKQAKILSGAWILIDGRDKPRKNAPWISASDVWLLKKIGVSLKPSLKTWRKQPFQDEYLTDVLSKNGFGSRFCLTIPEIDTLKPSIRAFLGIDPSITIRLPFFAEYNYLGNAIYAQWGTTNTWEWLEDTINDGWHLASGSGSVGVLGLDPPEYWSTILTFRPIIEL